MFYSGAADPRLKADLALALRYWDRPELSDMPLAGRLTAVARCQAEVPGLASAVAVRRVIRVALKCLADSGQVEHAGLLEARFIHRQSVFQISHDWSQSERGIYYQIQEAIDALAPILWLIECGEAGALGAPSPPQPAGTQPPGTAKGTPLPGSFPAPSYTRLFGADRLLDRLADYLDDPGAHRLISIEGMGGVGKTALAREAVSRAAARGRFAGIAWMTAKQEFYAWHTVERTDRPALTFEAVLDHILDQLDKAGPPRPLLLDAKRERACAVLQARPCLVVVDNLEAAADAEALPGWLWALLGSMDPGGAGSVDPGGAGTSKFLLTSRHRARRLPGSEAEVLSLFVEQLAEADALALLRHEAEQGGCLEVAGAPDADLRPVLAVTGGHPLAIKLVAGQLRTLPLDRILAALQPPDPGADPFYEFLYRPSWERLSDGAREVLAIMALLPAGGVGWDELAGSSARPAALDEAIDELAARSLLEVGGGMVKTYSLHPLTHRFAASHAPAAMRDAAVRRMGECYLAYVRRHEDDWQALARRQEHIVQAIDHGLAGVAGGGPLPAAVEAARRFGEFMYRHGHLSIWMPRLERAAAAAGVLGDATAQAELWNQQGRFKASEGDVPAALALHSRAAEVFRRQGDWLALAQTLRVQGNAHYSLADFDAAAACYEQAREQLAGRPTLPADAAQGPDAGLRELGYVCHNLAGIYSQREDWARALTCYTEALAHADQNDRAYVSRLRANLGLAYREMGCWRQAAAELHQILPWQSESGDRVGEANSHHYLCVTYGCLEAWDEALYHARRALALRKEMGSPDGLASLYTDLAAAYVGKGEPDKARACLELAEPVWRDLNRPGELGRMRIIEGEMHARQGAWAASAAAYREALGLLPERPALRSRRLAALLGWATARLEQGEAAAARSLWPEIQALVGVLDRPDLRVRALWLEARLDPARHDAVLDAALALCGPPGAGNDRLDALRRQTLERRSG